MSLRVMDLGMRDLIVRAREALDKEGDYGEGYKTPER